MAAAALARRGRNLRWSRGFSGREDPVPTTAAQTRAATRRGIRILDPGVLPVCVRVCLTGLAGKAISLLWDWKVGHFHMNGVSSWLENRAAARRVSAS